MNERISNVNDIVAANDLVEVVGSYFPLNPAGSLYEALCPFHHGETPSFLVDPAAQTFRCEVCASHGDVVAFVMEYEHLEWTAAVKKLAARAGIRVRAGGLSESAVKLIESLAARFPPASPLPAEYELRRRLATAEGLLLALPVADRAGYIQLRDEILGEVQARADEMIMAAIELVSRSR